MSRGKVNKKLKREEWRGERERIETHTCDPNIFLPC